MTRAGNIIGTLEYMAPEQVKGQETDARSDIYALGMMLYEVLTGKTPFDTENEFELMKLQTEAMPQNPREIKPDIPEEVEAAIMQAIAKDPDERFQTAGEFREVLLDAGFAATGAMHGATGTFKTKTNTRPSKPAVSQSGTAPAKSEPKATRLGESIAAPVSNAGMKETRLDASVATAGAAGAIKSTRLGVASQQVTAEETVVSNQAGGSFFSRLTPLHYIGAGVVGLILIGLLAIVPLVLLRGASKAEEVKPADKPAAIVDEKPAIVTMPQAAPPAQTTTTISSQPLSTEPSKPLQTQSTGDLKPIQPSAPVTTAPKPVEKKETVAQKPAAPKPAAPKKPSGGQKKSAEDLLTGN
jgi:hypothetical protein